MDYWTAGIIIIVVILLVMALVYFIPSASASTPPPTLSPATGDVITSDINQKRALHHAPPLLYDPTLAATAQQWADTIASSTVRHSSNPYGENIHVRFGLGDLDNQTLILDAIQSWYNEIRDYNFSDPAITSKNGHFTCLVWKDSRIYGIGIARNGDKAFIVMNTSPRQVNDRAALLANVLPA